MGSFTDQMKHFTDHLTSSIEARKNALAEVGASTEQLLDGARSFLNQVTQEKQAMAHHLHATLGAQSNRLVNQVAAMRKHNQSELQKMREDLQRSLKSDMKARHKTVSDLRHDCRHSQHELASDLRKASRLWHHFAAQHSS